MIALAAIRRLLLRHGADKPQRSWIRRRTGRCSRLPSTWDSRRRRSDATRPTGTTCDLRRSQGVAASFTPVVVVVSNLHNPTSAEATAGEILALLDALPAGSYVLVDETFVNAGRGRDSVARLGDPRLVAVGSLSKDPASRAALRLDRRIRRHA